MSRWINADIYVTATLYDDEHEEYRDERTTIAECLDRFTDEGCPTEDKPKKGWIPCSERLPFAEYGESDIVLVTCESTLKRLLFFDGGNWCYPTGERYEHRIDKVVAWMPLPEPYKEEECLSK